MFKPFPLKVLKEILNNLRYFENFLLYWNSTFTNFRLGFSAKKLKSLIYPKRIEYILEGSILEKSVKRPFCCTVSILQVYFTYLCYITFWALEYKFYRKSKINVKRKPNYEIGWFHT